MAREHYVGVHLPEGTASLLTLFSKASGQSKSEVIREALSRHLDSLRPCPIQRMASLLLTEWRNGTANFSTAGTFSEYKDDALKYLVGLGVDGAIAYNVCGLMQGMHRNRVTAG